MSGKKRERIGLSGLHNMYYGTIVKFLSNPLKLVFERRLLISESMPRVIIISMNISKLKLALFQGASVLLIATNLMASSDTSSARTPKLVTTLLAGVCLLPAGTFLASEIWNPAPQLPKAPLLPTVSYATHSDLYSEKIAIIVELREHPNLVLNIRNVARILDDTWLIQIFHGRKNLKFIQEQLADLIETERVILTELSVETFSSSDYNTIMLRRDFWEEVRGEHVLTFELDSGLCNDARSQIDQYLGFDSVGAPWSPGISCTIYSDPKTGRFYVFSFGFDDEAIDRETAKLPSQLKLVYEGHVITRVGNSGLSLRRKQAMLKIIDSYVSATAHFYKETHDIFLACAGLHAGLNISSVDMAKQFSVWQEPHDHPVGFHKPWLYLTEEELSALNQTCPLSLIQTSPKPQQ